MASRQPKEGSPEARAEYSRRVAELDRLIEQMPADQQRWAKEQMESPVSGGSGSPVFDSIRGELDWLRRQAEGESD